MKKRGDFPVVMPPQTLYSPSEQKGFLLRQLPRTLVFSCGVMLLVAVVLVVVVLNQMTLRLGLPVRSGGIVLLAIAAYMVVMAGLHQRDLE